MPLHFLNQLCNTVNRAHNVHTNMTLRHIRVTTGSMEEQYILHILSVCLYRYLACNAHMLDYTAICNLSTSTIFFHIISH